VHALFEWLDSPAADALCAAFELTFLLLFCGAALVTRRAEKRRAEKAARTLARVIEPARPNNVIELKSWRGR
jgi:hypothetical protein